MAIVGAGVSGLASALALAERGSRHRTDGVPQQIAFVETMIELAAAADTADQIAREIHWLNKMRTRGVLQRATEMLKRSSAVAPAAGLSPP